MKDESFMFCDYKNPPRDAEGPFHLDKSQQPCFRIRYDKTNFYVR